MKRLDLIGRVFGRLTVVRFLGVKSVGQSKQKKTLWEAKCECGNIVSVIGGRLTLGITKSCGCYKIDRAVTHGMSYDQFYKLWGSMVARTTNILNPSYENYGGRGIGVEWESFEAFKNDMYEDYLNHQNSFGSANTSLERIDNNKNYSKENCRWATRSEQGRNRRSNILITFMGKTQCLQDWADQIGISRTALKYRLKNWTLERALCNPTILTN